MIKSGIPITFYSHTSLLVFLARSLPAQADYSSGAFLHEHSPHVNSKEDIILEEVVEEKAKKQQGGHHERVENPA